MEEQQKISSEVKNVALIITFVLVCIVVGAIVVAKLSKKTTPPEITMQNHIQAVPTQTGEEASLTPTPIMDTSDTQLDKDVQTAQGTLDNLDANITSTDQSINNQSADTPQ